MRRGWREIIDEARRAFRGPGRFPLRAYSEYMPPPWVVLKPYDTLDGLLPSGHGFPVSEYEEVQELRPGLDKIARHVIDQLGRLTRGETCQLSKKLLEDNPAWPEALAQARAPRAADSHVVILPLALSRTQDDKGHVRWTLFGSSHHGPAQAFWRSFGEPEVDRFLALCAWALATAPPALDELGVVPLGPDPDFPEWSAGEQAALPGFARARLIGDDAGPAQLAPLRAVVTFRPFAALPPAVKQAHLAGRLALIPCPASQVFFHHRSYRRLAHGLPLAMQVPLLHLFPRSEESYGLRIPQSGWLDEHLDGPPAEDGHHMRRGVVRTHRFQRVDRQANVAAAQSFGDKVSAALFSCAPDDLGLYGKPMAKNAQVWSAGYQALLDGPSASPAELAEAARAVDVGGRFGYRFFFPPMRVGARSLYWHRPLVAMLDPGAGAGAVRLLDPPLDGYLAAERAGDAAIELDPELLARDGHVDAARLFEHGSGPALHNVGDNVRKLLEWRELMGRPLEPSFAERLLHAPRHKNLGEWLADLPARASDPAAGQRLAARLGGLIGAPLALASDHGVPSSLTYGVTRTRDFEVRLWRTIASLAEGNFREKDNADQILVNDGKTGGKSFRETGRKLEHGRDLDRLADHLQGEYRALIERHGMTGRAAVYDLPFKWETDFAFDWSRSWRDNQSGKLVERNVVMLIPGKNRHEAVVMGDHYDTAYMEDVYDQDRGGDLLRAAAAGADDNHSATSALMLAADVLLPMARAGQLERDVWLVHLTGEEFPSDCLGARALCQQLVEGRLAVRGPDGPIDLSGVRVRGAFVLDMVAHNHDRDPDVFQIAPGEGPGSALLAWHAHVANQRWNQSVAAWNLSPERHGRGRSQRSDHGAHVPEVAAHPSLCGEVRPEWDPRSALYNTDGQIFSDCGIPVVLFMENYDIMRQGYHDTHDTMKNIDLDYGAALIAIAIETVAQVATAKELG